MHTHTSLESLIVLTRAKVADDIALCPTINVVTTDRRKPTLGGSLLEQL